ncbi:MAG: hypothetical protein U0586_07500 [Candidatus Brocadiaceae bacterium]
MAIMQIRNVQYRYYDGTDALCGINLDILKGEFLAILGQNGSKDRSFETPQWLVKTNRGRSAARSNL